MQAMRRNRFTRFILVLVFLLGVLTVSLSAPKTVNACGYEYYWVYYSDEYHSSVVGECWAVCNGPGGCWGSLSEYRDGYVYECPCWP